MKLGDIYELMARFERSGLSSFTLELDGTKLRLQKGGAAPVSAYPAAAPAPMQDAPAAVTEDYITAPLVGTFYAASAPGEPPLVQVGDRVKEGQSVCVLEAMKMMSQVPAPADCIIEEVLLADGALVAFGAPMFRIKAV